MKVRVGLIQMKASDDPQANLEKAVKRTVEAAKKGAQIVCLQELFRSKYFCQVEDAALFNLAETIPGQSTERFQQVAREHGIVVIVPVFEKRAPGLYHNSVVVVDADGSIAGVYRKMHIPDDPNFYEKFYFTPGDLGFKSFQTRFGKIGVLICWDQWYPEGARITALSGAQILFYPTAIGFSDADRAAAKKQQTAWQTIQRSHGVANGVFVAAPNRVGREGDLTFWGHSFVCGPLGEIVAQASDGKEEILLANVDLDEVERTRRGWPFLRDRRIDAYGPILSRWLDDAPPAPATPAPATGQPASFARATPAQEGYAMPAEWEKHEATWLAWPHDPITFPNRVAKAEDVYKQMIRALTPHEKVHLIVKDKKTEDKVLKWAAKESVKNLRVHRHDVADVWIRDYGPIFLKRATAQGKSELLATDWIFNAWGGKYKELMPDDTVPTQVVGPFLKVPVVEPGIVLEGGSIEVNGKGTLMTTEQCLLNKNRNPHLTRAQIEDRLRENLGVTHFVWLPGGIEGDDTDGHIDDVARFVDARTIACIVEDDPRDENYKVLQANYEALKRARDQDGKPFKIVKLPTPGFLGDGEGRLPASYANFYVANKVVLLPVFNHPNDKKAIATLRKCFPTRKVVPIYCGDLIYGMGAIHCVTQQQPAL